MSDDIMWVSCRGGVVCTLPVWLAGEVTKGHGLKMTGVGGRGKRNHQNMLRGDIYNGREKISGSNNRLPSRDHGDQLGRKRFHLGVAGKFKISMSF